MASRMPGPAADIRGRAGEGPQPVGVDSETRHRQLDDIVDDPQSVWDLPRHRVEALLGHAVIVQQALLARLLSRREDREQRAATRTDALLTMPAVAEQLNVPLSFAYELARRGTIPTVRVGKKYVRVEPTALQAAVKSWTHEAPRVEESRRLAYRPRHGAGRRRTDATARLPERAAKET
jgi:excisionase family DNA binding protein